MGKKKPSPVTTPKPAADCGVGYEHTWHKYQTPRGKIKVCDGSVTKRSSK